MDLKGQLAEGQRILFSGRILTVFAVYPTSIIATVPTGDKVKITPSEVKLVTGDIKREELFADLGEEQPAESVYEVIGTLDYGILDVAPKQAVTCPACKSGEVTVLGGKDAYCDFCKKPFQIGKKAVMRQDSKTGAIIKFLGEHGESKKQDLMIAAYSQEEVEEWKRNRGYRNPFTFGDGMLGMKASGLLEQVPDRFGFWRLTDKGKEKYHEMASDKKASHFLTVASLGFDKIARITASQVKVAWSDPNDVAAWEIFTAEFDACTTSKYMEQDEQQAQLHYEKAKQALESLSPEFLDKVKGMKPQLFSEFERIGKAFTGTPVVRKPRVLEPEMVTSDYKIQVGDRFTLQKRFTSQLGHEMKPGMTGVVWAYKPEVNKVWINFDDLPGITTSLDVEDGSYERLASKKAAGTADERDRRTFGFSVTNLDELKQHFAKFEDAVSTLLEIDKSQPWVDKRLKSLIERAEKLDSETAELNIETEEGTITEDQEMNHQMDIDSLNEDLDSYLGGVLASKKEASDEWMRQYLIQIGYNPEVVASYSEKRIENIYRSEKSRRK